MTELSRASLVLAVLSLLGPFPGQAADAVPDYLMAAIADSARPPQQVARDAERKPAAVLAFAGVKPGDRVADFMSGGAYFTRLFSRIVGKTGHVYAFLPEEQLKNCASEETAGTRAIAHDASYANVSVLTAPVARFRPPEPLDLIWVSLSFHDLYDSFMGPADVGEVTQALFDALKPGGELLVVDHVAQAGSEVRDTETLHRIDPEVIIRSAQMAGFRLEAHSEVLRNPHDTHQLRVFDAAIRGRTDQVILKFTKPPAAAAPTAACDSSRDRRVGTRPAWRL
jgi:predicted methyltransferase